MTRGLFIGRSPERGEVRARVTGRYVTEDLSRVQLVFDKARGMRSCTVAWVGNSSARPGPHWSRRLSSPLARSTLSASEGGVGLDHLQRVAYCLRLCGRCCG